MRSSQPNVIPLVAKGLNARKYPGVGASLECLVLWGGQVAMRQEGDLVVFGRAVT